MKIDNLLHAVTNMRDRGGLQRIIHAAEARDAHLLEKESSMASKKFFEKFKHLKRGQTVFVHDAGGDYAPTTHQALFGKPLTVRSVFPRDRRIEVTCPGLTGVVKLRWSVLKRLKVSEEPHPKALQYVLEGGQR